MQLPFSQQEWEKTPKAVREYLVDQLEQTSRRQILIQQTTQRIKSHDWQGSEFVGAYEKSGYPICISEEQWLWKFRDLIRGVVLDMSTPKHWHQFIHELPNVKQVLISNLDSEIVEKYGKSSRVDVVGDFCAVPPPLARESVDTILCISILEHCEEPLSMIYNLASILKPGGYLMCLCPFAYIDGHMYPDYWRFGRDGYSLMFKKASLDLVQSGQFSDLGKYTIFEVGIDCSKNDYHRGIPMANWAIARKPTTDTVSFF
jgi:hypothetical protein